MVHEHRQKKKEKKRGMVHEHERLKQNMTNRTQSLTYTMSHQLHEINPPLNLFFGLSNYSYNSVSSS